MKEHNSQANSSSEQFLEKNPQEPRVRRVEDELRLRELELQTNFQIQTLSESLNILKVDFHSWRDALNEKIEAVKTQVNGLNTRLTVVIFLALAQLSGVNLGAMARMIGG